MSTRFWFKHFDPEGLAGMAEWARTRWHYADGIDPVWHPAVRAEIGRLLIADAKAEMAVIERIRA